MNVYADSNFFPPLFLPTKHTADAIHLVKTAGERSEFVLPITWLHRMEIANAIELYVFTGRRGQPPTITPEQAAIAQATFRDDLVAGTFLRRTVIAPEQIEAHFEELSLRYTARHGFRTYDLMHVAHALALGCERFWSFDARAAQLAKLEGLSLL